MLSCPDFLPCGRAFQGLVRDGAACVIPLEWFRECAVEVIDVIRIWFAGNERSVDQESGIWPSVIHDSGRQQARRFLVRRLRLNEFRFLTSNLLA